MRKTLRYVGVAAIASIVVWAATGVGWWSPIMGPQDVGRGAVLFGLHAVAVIGFVFSYAP